MNTTELLTRLLEQAVCRFYNKDKDLLCREHISRHCNASTERHMERESVFRIGIYMQQLLDICPEYIEFEGLNLDSEYHTNMSEEKMLSPKDKRGKRPDLILHKRLSNDQNMLMVEFKPDNANNADIEQDLQKLMAFTNPEAEPAYLYGYLLGASVQLKRDKAIYTFVQEGQIIGNKEVCYE